MSKSARWMLRGVVLVVAVIGLWGICLGRQWMLRRRAENLLSDIKALDLNHSTWTDAERMMTRWGHWGHYNGSCTKDDCSYTISMNDALYDEPGFVYNEGRHLGRRFLDRLGLRGTMIVTRFRVYKGLVTNKSFGTEVALPARDWIRPDGVYWPTLDVSTAEQSRLPFEPTHFWLTNPNHQVMLSRVYLMVRYTHQETPALQAAFMDYRLQCITQWSPCRSRAELLPEAEAEFQAGQRGPHTVGDRGFSDACPTNPELPARQYPDVLVGDVLHAERFPHSSQEDHGGAGSWWKVTFRNDGNLKGKFIASEGTPVSLSLPLWSAGIPTEGKDLQFPSKILLLGTTHLTTRTEGARFAVGDCGTYAATPENLSAAKLGASEDFSPGP